MKNQIYPGDFSNQDFYQLVIGSVGPRPIALISTIDNQGIPNLAPFSFFNVFSVQPFIVAFSTSLKTQRPIHIKDTFRNVRDSGECVINVVSGEFMHQMTICSADYPEDIDEFAKAGLTRQESALVAPPSVLESKANMECKVNQIIELGDPIAGYLVICNVVRMMISDHVIDGNRINPNNMNLIGRLGRNFYSKTDDLARIEIPRPIGYLPIGFDKLPHFLKSNSLLSGSELYNFALMESLEVGEEWDSTVDFNLAEEDFLNRYIRPILNIDVKLAYSMLVHFYNPAQ